MAPTRTPRDAKTMAAVAVTVEAVAAVAAEVAAGAAAAEFGDAAEQKHKENKCVRVRGGR